MAMVLFPKRNCVASGIDLDLIAPGINGTVDGMSSDRPTEIRERAARKSGPFVFKRTILMLDQPILQSANISARYDDVTLRLLCMKRDTCVAEARASGLNNLINDLWQFGLVTRTSLLGPVLQTRNYMPLPGGRDSGQVIQAALLVPRGLGVAVWDSEFYHLLVDVPDGLEAAAAIHHIPFEQCCPAWRALLSEHIAPLVERLFDWLLRT